MTTRNKGPRLVALLIDTAKAFDRKVIRGITAYVPQHGQWSLYVEEDPLDKIPDLGSWHGHGIIGNFDDKGVAESVSGLAIPVVGFGGGSGWYDPGSGIPYISKDNRGVARLAAEHLIERGFQNFGFCGLPPNRINGWSKKRADAFYEIITEAGFSCSTFSGRHTSARKWSELQHELAEWLDSLEKPLGLMACNDSRARHVLEACRNIGARVPEDVAVIGVDNDEMICELARPPLTSIDQGARRIGYESARLLDRLMVGEQVPESPHVVQPEGVVTRQSTDTLAIEDPEVCAALQVIRWTPIDRLQVQDVVDAVSVSRSTLENRFKGLLGRTIHAEIYRQRIDQAKRLMVTTDVPLKQIASDVGFATIQYMTSQFRRHVGLTPAEFRRRRHI